MAHSYRLGGFHHHWQHGRFLSKHRGCACHQLLKTSPSFSPRGHLSLWLAGTGLQGRGAYCCCHSSAPSAGQPRSPPAAAERGLCHRGLIKHLVKLPLLPPTTLGLCRSHVCPPEAGSQAASQPLASPFCSGSSVQKHRERFKEQAKR